MMRLVLKTALVTEVMSVGVTDVISRPKPSQLRGGKASSKGAITVCELEDMRRSLLGASVLGGSMNVLTSDGLVVLTTQSEATLMKNASYLRSSSSARACICLNQWLAETWHKS